MSIWWSLTLKNQHPFLNVLLLQFLAIKFYMCVCGGGGGGGGGGGPKNIKGALYYIIFRSRGP